VASVPTIRLNNGVEIPQLGFGVFQIKPADTVEATRTALETGYRHIDTAQMYGNEKEVGQAVRESGIDRGEVFVTSKLNNNRQERDDILRSFDQSLADLGFDYLDLFLIHWPLPAVSDYVKRWNVMEEIYASGRAKAVGVSNFQPAHLRRVIDETGTVPAVNQIELHPYLTQREPRDVHAEHDIATEAWSPLAKGGDLLKEQVVTSLAEKYGRTAAQIVLRWHVQLGNVVIPKSVTPSRVRENFDLFDFELADDDVESISALDRGLRTGPDPDQFN
jgi:2,5-diketo-D-gluconate reductase A